MASMALKGLLREYTEVHGYESLIPKRKEPFRNGDLQKMLSLPHGTHVGKQLYMPQTELWVTWRALLCVLAQSGMRKAEVAVPNGQT